MLVKGTMLVDMVKAINGFKDKPWDEYLTEDAKKLVVQRILPSVWYPAEPALNCLRAVYELIGGSDPEVARQWGKVNGKRTFEEVYNTIFVGQGNVIEVLKKFSFLSSKALFTGLELDVKEIDKKHYQVRIFDDNPRTEPVYYFVQGWTEVIIEMTGGENISVNIIEKHWEGAEATVFDIRWE